MGVGKKGTLKKILILRGREKASHRGTDYASYIDRCTTTRQTWIQIRVMSDTTTRGTTTRHNGIHRRVSARRREVLLRAIAMYYYASQRGWFRVIRFNQRARTYIDR